MVLILDLEILSDRMERLRASASLTMILPLIPTSIFFFFLAGYVVMYKNLPVVTAVINNNLSCFEVSGLHSCFC